MYWLDGRRLVSGTRYRGELEERIARIGREAAAGHGRLVLVLDRPELLVGGESGPSGGAALAALLESGGWLLPMVPEQLSAVEGAVPDWDRLVQSVAIPEWDDESAAGAVTGWLPALAEHHDRTYPAETSMLAVRLSRRYLRTPALPGAAVDLLDQAGALARVDGSASVGRAQLLASVAVRTGLPLAGLDASLGLGGNTDRWVRAEQVLQARVVGQPRAVGAVAGALRRARVGIGDARRPLGSFLFVGPTGVGKTELARAVADFLFGDEDALVRIDMSEYMERHAVARLIGAPPGYVGFDLPGQLTDPVRRRPFSVVLFDEAEKAHPDVLNLLLQVLEDGRLTDGYGRTVDFRHTVVVLTSNAGSTAARDADVAGDEARLGEIYVQAARQLLRPELLNRLDDVVLFPPLSQESIERIVDLQLARATRRLDAWGLQVRLTPATRHALALRAYHPEYGARPLRRLIEREVLDPIAHALLSGQDPTDLVEGVVVIEADATDAPTTSDQAHAAGG